MLARHVCRVPTIKDLVSRYMCDLSWRTFRKRVMGTLEKERAGHLVATMSATSKGSSGWARWPGFDPLAEQKTGLLSERGAKSKVVILLLLLPLLLRLLGCGCGLVEGDLNR